MARLRFLSILLVFACAVTPLWAEDEDPAPRPPPPPEQVLLATVEGDPEGGATQLATDIAVALGDDDLDLALTHLLTLAAEYPDALLPLKLLGARRNGRADGALQWPARRAVNRAIARLPAAQRARAAEAWAARMAALTTRVARGDEDALRILAEDHGVTPAGSRALLALADRAMEAGHHTRAARRYEAWLELNLEAEPAARAAVAVRLADALVTLQDAGGLQALGLLQHELRDIPVPGATGTTTLADRLARARTRTAARREAAPRAPAADVPLETLEDPVLLWSSTLRDPDYLRQGQHGGAFVVQAGAHGADEGTLILHEGRVVRRLDAATGLERWRFPRTRRPTLHDLVERYQGHDLPWRSVTPAGDTVLVALGEPAASGRYEFLGEEYEADELGQECRVRLACLDIATGALRWHTGAVDDTDPVLGHRTTGLCAPPLVVGDDLYCLFAKRDGATSFHVARLDRHTGRPHWVCRLVGGDSGRDDDVAQGARFTSPFAQSVPWGARPALADGELCVVPHAGFAAGVDAHAGRVRWVRALPRYALDSVVASSEGHSVQNEPLPWGDAWILAPMDAPRMLCLARGSGDLRWQVGARTPSDLPPWRDLLGIVAGEDGAPVLRLSGEEGVLRIDPADGARYYDADEPWEVGEADPGGRVLDVGPYALRATNGGVQARPWQPSGDLDRDAPFFLTAEAGMPHAGDLVRAGRIWLVVGPEGVAALAQPGDVDDLLATGNEDEPALRATRLALHGRLQGDVRRVASAVEAARAVKGATLRGPVFAQVAAELLRAIEVLQGEDEELAGLRALAVVARTLPSAERGPALRTLARRFFVLDADDDGARLCLQWIASADDTLVPRARHWDPLRDDRLRGDLMAARLLRKHAARPAVAAVLAEYERSAADRFAALDPEDEPGLRAAIRRHVGTRAAARARRRLLARLVETRRFAAAAGVVADLRLDPPWSEGSLTRAERLRSAALLQMEEADLLARAGEGARARTLAAELERWAPAGVLDRRGRDPAALVLALRERFGWHPYLPERPAEPYPFDVWREDEAATSRDETRSIEFLALNGPGAARLAEEYVVLVRGLTVEVWSLAERRRVARLPGADEGWFGGSLRSIERWVPGGGILVTSLVAGEPADGSGVRDGDWIHTWAGHPVTDLPAFMQLVASSEPGRTIPVGIWRQGKRVLTRFTAGRRPVGQGRLVLHKPLWVDEQLRVLVPGRTGLTWVDPRKATRTPHWSWKERGVVRRCLAVGGDVYVSINRGILPDLVVAVDAVRGTERWRAEVQGGVTWFEPVGSGLWIHTVAPGQGLLVDREDGRPRARFRTFDRYRHAFRKNWEPDREVALAAGRGYVSAGTDSDLWFRIVNTTTGSTQEAAHWKYAGGGGFRGRYVNPQVSAGAYATVACQGGLRFFFGDPLGEQPPRQLQAARRDLMGTETHHGPIDSDTRLYVRGHTLYVVRMPLQGRKNVNVHVFGIDYDALRRRPLTAQGSPGPVLFNRTHRAWLTGPSSPYRYTLNVRATFEGILVSTAQLSGGHHGETWWIACATEDSYDENRDLKLLWSPMAEARRHAPRPVGARLFVPVDRGARVFPIRRYADESK